MQAPFSSFQGATAIAADLAALATNDSPSLPNGYAVFVVSENETYQLDTVNPLTTSSPLIVARGGASGAGKWYRRSRAYVVGNFTLWVAPFGGSAGQNIIAGFTPGQLQSSNSSPADILLDLNAVLDPTVNRVADVVTDEQGNLWVQSFLHPHPPQPNGDSLKLALKDCLASGSPTPLVHLTGIGTNIPTNSIWTSAAFDKQNSLWIAYPSHGTFGVATFLKYGPPTYGHSGAPEPDIRITLSSVSADTAYPCFDGSGNLWASVYYINEGPVGGVVMLAEAQLRASSSSLTPAVFWKGSNFTQAGPGGIAFGPNGLLWVVNYQDNTVKGFDPRSPQSGNPAPVLTVTSTTFNGAWNITFDPSGNLWICNFNDNKIMMFTRAQYESGGLLVPTVVLNQPTITTPMALTFPGNVQRSGLIRSPG